MNKQGQIEEVSAEMLLNYLYPQLEEKWIVEDKGNFYRNYNNDILSIYVDESRVELSRDGFARLLPQGLFFRNDELKDTDDVALKTKKLEQRKRLVEEIFLPLDSLHFRQKLKIERQVAALLSGAMGLLIKKYFRFDLDAERNPYIKKMAILLPFAKQWRGDFATLRHMIGTIFGCDVAMTEGRSSESDSIVRWMPMVRYDLLIPGLDTESFRSLNAEVQPFADFVNEWFIPVDVICQIKIKEHGHQQTVNAGLMLDYNTEL